MTATDDRRAGPLRQGDGRVTQLELFFDLVFVFAVTQLSLTLREHLTAGGAVQTAILLAMVWQIWVYTGWTTNYLDPNQPPMRLALLALMLGSLVMAASLPSAFGARGGVVAVTYVLMQVGRSLFAMRLLRGERLERVFQRITAWCALAAIPMLAGMAVAGHAREALWALTVLIELGGAAIGFYVPGLGRPRTSEWAIDGGHFAERCQAFVLIALGESIVVSGGRLHDFLEHDVHAEQIAAFVVAFLGSVALWWVYFDRAAEDSARRISESDDPGRLARNAFHYVHPVLVAGVIVGAAADEIVLQDPQARGVGSTSWLLLGGSALYLAGHALFKAIVWHLLSWPRLAGVAVLAALAGLAPHVSAFTLSVATVAVLIGVIVTDRLQQNLHALATDANTRPA